MELEPLSGRSRYMDSRIVLLENVCLTSPTSKERKEARIEHILVFHTVHAARRKSELQLSTAAEAGPCHQRGTSEIPPREHDGVAPQVPPVVMVTIRSIKVELFFVAEDHLE